jgi:hypothetical protein
MNIVKPTFRELCSNNPAVAIKTLIDSLSNQQRIPWLKLSYADFRDVRNNICYGCGATYTVLNLFSTGSSIEPINPSIFINEWQFKEYLGYNLEDLIQFEDAIDRFRMGKVTSLACYFHTILPSPIEDWHLHDGRPLSDLPLIQDYYDRLVANQITA